jgi:hypothetical protein
MGIRLEIAQIVCELRGRSAVNMGIWLEIAQLVWAFGVLNACCDGYEKHLPTCEQKLAQDNERAPEDVRPQGKVNVVLGSEPLLAHSVEVQHNWTDAELYPHSSFTFKPAQPLPVEQGAKRKKRSRRQSPSRKRMTRVPPLKTKEKCLFERFEQEETGRTRRISPQTQRARG